MNTLHPHPEVVSHTDTHIHGFFGDYRWLSNFFSCPVMYGALVYPSSEHAYQAAKCHEDQRESFLTVSAGASKKLGRKGTLYTAPQWDAIKDEVMREIVISKMSGNPELADRLIKTGDRYLEETNWWGDRYWGVCKGVGENKLGHILMEERKRIQAIHRLISDMHDSP